MPHIPIKKKDDLSNKIQSILNKLTPNIYDKLFLQLKEIDISIEANMELFISIIFPKQYLNTAIVNYMPSFVQIW